MGLAGSAVGRLCRRRRVLNAPAAPWGGGGNPAPGMREGPVLQAPLRVGTSVSQPSGHFVLPASNMQSPRYQRAARLPWHGSAVHKRESPAIPEPAPARRTQRGGVATLPGPFTCATPSQNHRARCPPFSLDGVWPITAHRRRRGRVAFSQDIQRRRWPHGAQQRAAPASRAQAALLMRHSPPSLDKGTAVCRPRP